MKHILGIKELALSEYAISANAILGIRDSGKTWAGCEAAEELFDAGVPVIAFDPIGKWHSLRQPGTGKGYPFVVAGGKYADLELSRKNAAELVRAAMRQGVSLVLDLFDRNVPKTDWRFIVKECAEILLYENEDHGLRHVFIEEAGEFVPQRVMDGQVFSAVEKLVRMGGNSKLGATLIHQRPADINKSVLELCANVVLLRQTGKNTLTDLKKWTDLVAPDQTAEVGKTLPIVEPGHGWAFIAAQRAPIFFKVPQRNSRHPDRRAGASAEPARKPVDASSFIEQMRSALGPKAKAPATKPAASAPVPIAATERALTRAFEEGRQTGFDQGWAACRESWRRSISPALVRLEKELLGSGQAKTPPARQGASVAPVSPGGTNGSAPRPPRAQAAAAEAMDGASGMPRGQRTVLTAIAQHPRGCTKAQLTVLTGYKKTTRNLTLQQLKAAGLIEAKGDRFVASALGVENMGFDFQRLPTGDALREKVLAELPAGERAVLEVAIRYRGANLSREAIRELTGYQKTTTNLNIQRLAARELVEVNRSGITVSPELFS